jgi:hypothetical protein
MFYVLDQNVMRSPVLANLVRSRPDASFIVPDTAFVEMVKSERWEDTMRGSFAALTTAVNRTFASLSVSEATRRELATLRPVDQTVLLPDEFTDLIRELISALARVDGSPALDSIRRRIDALRSELLAEEVDFVAEKKKVEHLVSLLRKACRPEMEKDLRSGRMGRNARLGLMQLKGDEMLIRNFGIDPDKAEAFRRSKPLLLRNVYLRLWYAMWWARQGGLTTAKPTKVLNQRLDEGYVLIGSFYDETLTEDNQAKEADADLRLLLDDARREELRDGLYIYLPAESPVLQG